MCTVNDLISKLNAVEDWRRIEICNFKYSVSSIIGCAFCAVMIGSKGSRAIVDFIEENFVVYHMAFQAMIRSRGFFNLLMHKRWLKFLKNGRIRP